MQGVAGDYRAAGLGQYLMAIPAVRITNIGNASCVAGGGQKRRVIVATCNAENAASRTGADDERAVLPSPLVTEPVMDVSLHNRDGPELFHQISDASK